MKTLLTTESGIYALRIYQGNTDRGYRMIASRRILASNETSRTSCMVCGKRSTIHYYKARHANLHEGYHCASCLKDAYGYSKHVKAGYPIELWIMPEVVFLPLVNVIKGGRLE